MRRFLIILSMSFLSVACSQVRDRSGVELDFYPVQTTVSLDVHKLDSAKVQVDKFIQTHNAALLTSQINLSSSNQVQTRLAHYAKKRLLVLGVPAINIHMSTLVKGSLFELTMTEYQVKAGNCHYVNYNSLSTMSDDHGCSIESNRWLSMTNPERAAGLSNTEK